MLASLTRTKTFWLIVVVMLGWGIITLDDDDPGSGAKKPTDDGVNLVLQISMTDSARQSINVAVAATLGSSGRYSEASTKVWDGLRYPKTDWLHRFRARRGEALNAEVANPGKPVIAMFCWFRQEGVGSVKDADDPLPGYGDITVHHQNTGSLARCAAVVQ